MAFLALLILAIGQLIWGEEILGMAIVVQLIWAPVSLIHAVVKLIMNLDKNSIIARLYKLSFGISMAYFVVFFVASSNIIVSQHNNKLLTIAGVMVVPWLMLLFFVYILHKELQESKT